MTTKRCHICGRQLGWLGRLRKNILCWRLSCKREWDARHYNSLHLGGW